MLQPGHPDANFFEKTASGGQNGIILPCIYFHFRIMGISFISTVSSVDNTTIVANDATECVAYYVGFVSLILSPSTGLQLFNMNNDKIHPGNRDSPFTRLV